ncbi:DNA-binding protein [Paenibacillus dendritiformis C454]|uniref:DNA-binding protein n=2 Tax=Paenibacillus dendritiformis TaxID=130049 RepID=H3SJD6_9BACL|nr:DNA-binding protein [Paenibacillus dendritiformis C454]
MSFLFCYFQWFIRLINRWLFTNKESNGIIYIIIQGLIGMKNAQGLGEGDKMDFERRSIGEIIRLNRKRQELTLAELSALSGIPKGTISKIERGETRHPELDTVLAITSCLSISYTEVIAHYVNMERRVDVLHRILLDIIGFPDTAGAIEKVALRFLECQGIDSYELTGKLYDITLTIENVETRLALFELISSFARNHGIQPFVAKSLFQKYLIEREDFRKLDLTFQSGIYILNYINFLSMEERVLLHFKLGFHAYALQYYEKCINLCSYVTKERESDKLTKARALLLICNSYYYLGDYFMAEQYLGECKKFPFDEIQQNIKLNEAAIQGKKGNTDIAIMKLEACLEQSSPNSAIHIINELLELCLQRKDIHSLEKLIGKESQIINVPYSTPFKKSELALYFKLKAGYLILIQQYDKAIDCYIRSALIYSEIRAYKRANDCFYSIFLQLSNRPAENLPVIRQLKETFNALRMM